MLTVILIMYKDVPAGGTSEGLCFMEYPPKCAKVPYPAMAYSIVRRPPLTAKVTSVQAKPSRNGRLG